MKQGMETACCPAEGGNINDAKMRGGSDNITAKLLRIREIFA